jgi:hypothetical protein
MVIKKFITIIMFHQSDNLQKFTSKEKPVKRIHVQFSQAERFNALIYESWCPLEQRLAVAKEAACTREIIVLCETEEEALKTARYHFYSSGSNFNVIKTEDNI